MTLRNVTRGFVVVCWLVAPSARADEPTPRDQQTNAQPSSMLTKRMNVTATIASLDLKDRMMTLRMDDGSMLTVHAPRDTKELSQLKPGDQVQIDYYESLALSWSKAGPNAAGSTTVTSHTSGKLPSTITSTTVKSPVEIAGIDQANHKLTVKLANGETDTIDVNDPDMQSELQNLHVGDKINVTFTRASLLSVKRANP
jgi:Cu/Ag efflux protein CusF